jgi:cation diffusion facilitator CzcD-associated flavoprotein CzcO
MVCYFDNYVRRQNITLELGCEVTGVYRAERGWRLDTSSGEIQTRAIVLATGNYRTPTIPPWPGLSSFKGELVHSGSFSNAWPFRDRDVLVVGAGNSAADIAVQLADNGARRIWLAVRTPPHLVRRSLGPSGYLPRTVCPRACKQDRSDYQVLGAPDVGRPTAHGSPAAARAEGDGGTDRIPTLADGLIHAVRAGRVEVVAAVEAIEPHRVILGDGTCIPPAVIIAATGFSVDLEGLVGHLGVLDDRGKPRGGFASHIGDGMFAIGYGIPPNGPLRAIRRAATPLADEITAHLGLGLTSSVARRTNTHITGSHITAGQRS